MIIRLCAKCSDLCGVDLLDEDGNEIANNDGYVPDWMPGKHYGDYVMLDIDSKTGLILNWTKPSDETLRDWATKDASQ